MGMPYNFLHGSKTVSENAEDPDDGQDTPVGGPRPQLTRMRQNLGSALNGLELDLQGHLGVGRIVDALNQSTNAVNDLHRWLASNPLGSSGSPVPRIWRASRITGSAASTYSVLALQAPMDVGGPNGGLRWWLGAHFIQGTDPFTVVASSVVALYIGAIPPNDGTIAPDIEAIDSSIRYSVTTLPWGGTFGPRTVTIQPNDTIYWVVKSAGNNQKLTGSVIVYEYSERMFAGIV